LTLLPAIGEPKPSKTTGGIPELLQKLEGEWIVTEAELGNTPVRLEADNPVEFMFRSSPGVSGGSFSSRGDGAMATFRDSGGIPEKGI